RRAQAFPLGTPCVPPTFHGRRGFSFNKAPPSWAHKRTPKMGLLGKSFCYSVLFEILSITGREAVTIILCKSKIWATPVFASF
ncbi:MAG: hypothetical protein IKC97_07055, partial [Clostridia bacterium]|nr:hypothetical protein [Clostridia bacterium]